jgi:hypothetical protein
MFYLLFLVDINYARFKPFEEKQNHFVHELVSLISFVGSDCWDFKIVLQQFENNSIAAPEYEKVFQLGGWH